MRLLTRAASFRALCVAVRSLWLTAEGTSRSYRLRISFLLKIRQVASPMPSRALAGVLFPWVLRARDEGEASVVEGLSVTMRQNVDPHIHLMTLMSLLAKNDP